MVSDSLAGKGPGGGKAAGGVTASGTIMKDFRIEVAKAGGAGCRVCEVKIKKVFDIDNAINISDLKVIVMVFVSGPAPHRQEGLRVPARQDVRPLRQVAPCRVLRQES